MMAEIVANQTKPIVWWRKKRAIKKRDQRKRKQRGYRRKR